MNAQDFRAQAVLPALEVLRLQRGAMFLNGNPPRVTAGFLMDLASATDSMPIILSMLRDYEDRITPQDLHASGGDRFPPRPLHLVAGGRR